MLMTEPTGLKLMFALAVLGAGIVGAITLFLPHTAERYIFFGGTTADPYIRILGALWLTLGMVALLGILRPYDVWPVLLIQLLYKSIWLVSAAFPAIIRGAREPGLVFLTCLFSLWVLALILCVPFGKLVFAGA